jgi:uncharacterized protein YkwD
VRPLVALAALAAVAAVPVPSASAAGCPDADLVLAPGNRDQVSAAIVCLLNAERRAAGRHELSANRRLARGAAFHSSDMVGHRFLAHEAPGHPSLLTRIRRTGYFDPVSGGLYSENIGVAPQDMATAANLVSAWMMSEAHRARVLFGRFRDVGVGTAFAGPDPVFYADHPSVVFTTDFGRRYRSRCTRRTRTASGDPPRARRYCRRSRR